MSKDMTQEERRKVIEECMALVMTHTEEDGRYCDTGEDMDWACRSECVEIAVKRLEALIDPVLDAAE